MADEAAGSRGDGAGVADARLPIRRLADAPLHATGGIHMAYLYPWDGVVDTPYGSGWAIVGPGETSERHMHHDGETWFVMEGRGQLTQDGETREVGPGDVVYLPPFSMHTLHNPSATERVVFLTVWWQDMELASRHAERSNGQTKPRRVAIHTTQPTPNGDLHLGHLSGPYLGADVYARYLRMQGVDVVHVTGTDDWQSYVQGKALQTDQTPAQVADTFASRIEETLGLAGVEVDEFLRPLHDDAYVAAVQDMFKRLHEAGHIVAKDTEVLVAPEDGRVLFEFYVSGTCPHCGVPAGGGGCEECGRPNTHVDLGEAGATLTDAEPIRATVRRFVLPLAPHADWLRAYVRDAEMPVHLRVLAEQLLEDLPDMPATWPHEWGIPCGVEGFEDQVISSWFELGHGFLVGLQRAGHRAGWGAESRGLVPPTNTDIVQFFGFDNGMYFALLYPLLFHLAEPELEPPATMVCNEFYRLDGLKFSTSRNHAIWVRDLVTEVPVDLVRFYVCHTRPETEQTSFSRDAFDAFVEEELEGTWLAWLDDVAERLDADFDGVAPEAGLWTEAHRQHLAFLERTARTVKAAYDPTPFSTQTVTRALIELVRRTRTFAAAERHRAAMPGLRDEYRAAMALELLSVRTLAQLVAPIMPNFAARLWDALGLEGEVAFDRQSTFVPAGTRVQLATFSPFA